MLVTLIILKRRRAATKDYQEIIPSSQDGPNAGLGGKAELHSADLPPKFSQVEERSAPLAVSTKSQSQELDGYSVFRAEV
jgi:hypothetical protein